MILDQLYQEVTDIKNLLTQAQQQITQDKLTITDLQTKLDNTTKQLADALAAYTAARAQIPDPRDVIADKIIAAGLTLKMYDVPYVFGGDNQDEGGLDCSGFVKDLYDLHAGTNLPRVSGNMSKVGTEQTKETARKGDLLLFTYDQRNGGLPTHVSIYTGDGNMLHTNNDKERIHISAVAWNTVTTIRRVF